MSLSLDYITMPPKSQEASQIQVHEAAKLEHETQQMASQYQADVKKQSEQAIRRNKAENEELKNDEKKNGQKRKQNRKDSKQNKEEKQEDTNKMSGGSSHFDMRI